MPRPTKELIRLLTELGEKSPDAYVPEDRALFSELREATNLGLLRSAERGEDGRCSVNLWFKKALLAGFRLGQTFETEGFCRTSFFDKHTLPTRRLSELNKVRIVPGGTSIRDGAFIGEGVIVMPPLTRVLDSTAMTIAFRPVTRSPPSRTKPAIERVMASTSVNPASPATG